MRFEVTKTRVLRPRCSPSPPHVLLHRGGAFASQAVLPQGKIIRSVCRRAEVYHTPQLLSSSRARRAFPLAFGLHLLQHPEVVEMGNTCSACVARRQVEEEVAHIDRYSIERRARASLVGIRMITELQRTSQALYHVLAFQSVSATFIEAGNSQTSYMN